MKHRVRNAYFMNCSLNGMPMVFFQETRGNVETMATTFFRDKEEARKAIEAFLGEKEGLNGSSIMSCMWGNREIYSATRPIQ